MNRAGLKTGQYSSNAGLKPSAYISAPTCQRRERTGVRQDA